MPHTFQPSPVRAVGARRSLGFTLIELLVVIGIIALLVGILIPAISHMRQTGYETSSKAQIATLSTAIGMYHDSFGAYPGPVSNSNLIGGAAAGASACTGTENLTLGLMGGWVNSGTPAVPKYTFLATDVGLGPKSLNPAKVQRYPALIEATAGHLPAQATWGDKGKDVLSAYGNTGNLFKDTDAPEFLDRYPDPLPILYIRANIGVTNPTGTTPTAGQYNYSELAPYNFPEPNAIRLDAALANNASDPYLKAAKAGAPSPTDFRNYFTTSADTVYQRDGFILISAGHDRVYFSQDDINSFGSPR